MTALVLGTVLAVAALAFVLVPLFAAPRPAHPAAAPQSGPDSSNDAIAALREVEFDRVIGIGELAGFAVELHLAQRRNGVVR